MSKTAADRAFANAGVTADDVQVVELHDCFSANELITYEALGKNQSHLMTLSSYRAYLKNSPINQSSNFPLADLFCQILFENYKLVNWSIEGSHCDYNWKKS